MQNWILRLTSANSCRQLALIRVDWFAVQLHVTEMSGIIAHTSGNFCCSVCNRKCKKREGRRDVQPSVFVIELCWMVNAKKTNNNSVVGAHQMSSKELWTRVQPVKPVKCSLKFWRIWRTSLDDLVIPEDTLLSSQTRCVESSRFLLLWQHHLVSYTHICNSTQMYEKKSFSAERLIPFTFCSRGGTGFNEVLSPSCQGFFMMCFSQY